MLSDHMDGIFGSNYGTLIKECALKAAHFVVDEHNKTACGICEGSRRLSELRSRACRGKKRRRRDSLIGGGKPEFTRPSPRAPGGALARAVESPLLARLHVVWACLREYSGFGRVA